MAGGGGTKTKVERHSSLSPEQKELLGAGSEFLQGNMGRYQGNLDYVMNRDPRNAARQVYQEAMLQPAIQRYNEITVPGLRAKTKNLHGSYAQKMEQDAADQLAASLQGKYAQMLQQAETQQAKNILQGYQYSPEMIAPGYLGGTVDTAIMPGQQGANPMGLVGGLVGAGLGSFGGPAGAAAGWTIGSGAGSFLG
jgi:hypothetical protein